MTLFPHEASQQGRDLWELVKLWLPKNLIFPSQPDSSEWAGIYYAAKLLRDHLPPDHDLQEVYRLRLQTALKKLIEAGALTPVERAEMGRLLAVLGDSRPGVGLRPDGLPDIDWVEISAGKFLMGSDKAKDPEAQDDELPQREVLLPAYRISKYAITNAQFAIFVGAVDGYNNPAWWTAAGLAWKKDRTAPDEEDDPDFRLPNHPRIDVRWYEAVAFCRWLSAKLGNEARLPTEAEWEKAARGTDGRIYPYGNTFDAAKGNTDATKIGTTSAVGLFPDGASPYGVLDMSGNVWEWCATKWRGSYAEPADDDLNGTDGRVLRGGSWYYAPRVARAARRGYYGPFSRYGPIGFRVVLGSPPT